MLREITGFYNDEKGDWVAALNCCHGQHVRHNPPFMRRPWVVTEDGRRSRIGATVDCLKCNNMEWPQGLSMYRRSLEFNENSIPEYLKEDYSVSSGTWGRVIVLRGRLIYEVMDPLNTSFDIVIPKFGVIVPDIKCRIIPSGKVWFCIEYYSDNGKAPEQFY